MKIKLSTLIPTVKHEKETREAEPTKLKTEVEVGVKVEVPVEIEATQVNPDIPVAVPTIQRKLVDYNRGNLFLPDIPPKLSTPSTPKAASTDRREVSEGERTKKNPRNWIYDMPDDASDFEWMVEFLANCETHPLKSYENAQRDVETMEVTDDKIREIQPNRRAF